MVGERWLSLNSPTIQENRGSHRFPPKLDEIPQHVEKQWCGIFEEGIRQTKLLLLISLGVSTNLDGELWPPNALELTFKK